MKKRMRFLPMLIALVVLLSVIPVGASAQSEAAAQKALSIVDFRWEYDETLSKTCFELDIQNNSGKTISQVSTIPFLRDENGELMDTPPLWYMHASANIKSGDTYTLTCEFNGQPAVFSIYGFTLNYTSGGSDFVKVDTEYTLSKEFTDSPSPFFENTFSAGVYHSVFLREDGTVGAVGYTSKGRCDVEDWSDIIALSASSQTVGLKADGTVVAVGPNSNGQCDVKKWKDIIAVAAAAEHTVGLCANGTVVATGSNQHNRCDVSGWKDITAIAAGARNTYGLKASGQVVAVGSNVCGQKDIAGWNNITAISAGYNHVVGLKADGTVVAAGSNNSGQCDVENWEDIIAISTGYQYTLGLKKDGSVLSTNEEDIPTRSWRDIIAISAGHIHALGQKADGTLVAAGNNGHGRCNVEDAQVAIAAGNKGPRTIAGDVVQVAATEGTLVVLRTDGTVRAIGDNYNGQCDVEDWRDVVKIWAREGVTFGRTKDGRILSTSERYSGLTDIADLNLSPYDYDPRVGIKYDGTVVPMGIDETDPENKQFLEDISEWENITKVYAGGACILGLCEDGSVKITGWKPCQDNKPKDLGWKNIKDFCFEMDTFTTYAVAETGEVYCWKPDSTTYSKPVWKNVSKLVSGDFGSIYAITNSGNVVYYSGEEKIPLENFDHIVDLCAHSVWAMGLKEDGSVLFWEDYSKEGPTFEGLSHWKNVKQIKSTGPLFGGLREDGTLVYLTAPSYEEEKTFVVKEKEKIVDFWGIVTADFVYLTEDGTFSCANGYFSRKELDYLTAGVNLEVCSQHEWMISDYETAECADCGKTTAFLDIIQEFYSLGTTAKIDSKSGEFTISLNDFVSQLRYPSDYGFLITDQEEGAAFYLMKDPQNYAGNAYAQDSLLFFLSLNDNGTPRHLDDSSPTINRIAVNYSLDDKSDPGIAAFLYDVVYQFNPSCSYDDFRESYASIDEYLTQMPSTKGFTVMNKKHNLAYECVINNGRLTVVIRSLTAFTKETGWG